MKINKLERVCKCERKKFLFKKCDDNFKKTQIGNEISE